MSESVEHNGNFNSNEADCHRPLAEKYRPRCWSEVVGHESAIKQIERFRDNGSLAGRAYWISGKSGTGKTTIAKLIAKEVADELHTIEVDATSLEIQTLRHFEKMMSYRGISGQSGGRAFIINESHGLKKNIMRQLLDTLEPIPPYVVFIFTTTNYGNDALLEDYDDATPLLSRCQLIELSQRDITKKFAKRLQFIAQQEKLDNQQPLEVFISLLKECRNNFRSALQKIDGGIMLKKSVVKKSKKV